MMKLRRLAIAAALAVLAGPALAGVLVVRASGPSAGSYPAGKALADTARISLKADDMLVLLDSRGTRTLRGPGIFTPASPAIANQRSAIAAVAANTTSRRARIGAVRGVGAATAARSPSLWHLDISKSSNFCVADPDNVTLWRADAAEPVRLTVTGGGKSETLDWAAGTTTLPWPPDLAVGEGAGYRLAWPGGAAPTTIVFRALPSKPAGLEDMAAALIRNGCQAQLDLLIETVQLPDTPAG